MSSYFHFLFACLYKSCVNVLSCHKIHGNRRTIEILFCLQMLKVIIIIIIIVIIELTIILIIMLNDNQSCNILHLPF